MNIISIYGSHDASISTLINGEYRIYEIERFTNTRYYSLFEEPNYTTIYDYINDLIVHNHGNISFDVCLYKHVNDNQLKYIETKFGIDKFIEYNHHESHAYCAYYQSGYNDCLIVSFDGGGFDNGNVSFFNIYNMIDRKLTLLETIPIDLGTKYAYFAIPIKEIRKSNEESWGNHFLGFAGKLMGLAGYGTINPEWVNIIKSYYKSNEMSLQDFYNKSSAIKHNLHPNHLSGQIAYDLAASAQKAFEEVAYETILPYIEKYSELPICLTGGCALNVLFNEYLVRHGHSVYVPPNPNDCGLSFGAIVGYTNPQHTNINITYNGYPILDIDKLDEYVNRYNAIKVDSHYIAELIHSGKIIGVMYNNSECGPRALGNRSIICDPSYANMKDVLNSKVKFREWFRPFAPVVRREMCSSFFEFDFDSPFMSFAPNVKQEYRSVFPSITHVDGTARVQTVTQKNHEFFYDLLISMEKNYGKSVILNTSFNIKGRPILTSVEHAIEVLETTEIDGVIIEGYYFKKITKDAK